MSEEIEMASIDQMISAAMASLMESTADEESVKIGEMLEAVICCPDEEHKEVQKLIGAVNYAARASDRKRGYAKCFREDIELADS